MLFGAPGISTMGLIVGAAVPLANLVSVWMLARHGEVGLWREVARNPLIWGTAAGFILNLAGFVPPPPLQAFLGRLADSSIALGLITVGAALRLDGTPGVRGISLWLLAVKLLALPLIAAVVGRFGKLNTLVNAAGVGGMVRFDDLKLAEWNRVIAINLTGTYLTCHAALPHLLAADGASISEVDLFIIRTIARNPSRVFDILFPGGQV